jgi:hypothetical protein
MKIFIIIDYTHKSRRLSPPDGTVCAMKQFDLGRIRRTGNKPISDRKP